MKQTFFLLNSVLFFICPSAVQAQFTVEGNATGPWVQVKDADHEADQDEVIFGPVATGTVINRDFRFVNNTASTVTINEVDPGRTEFEILIDNAKINPGQTVPFSVRYTAGPQSRETLFNIINDSPGDSASYTFLVIGHVLPNSYTVEGREGGGSFEEIISGDTTPSANDGTLFSQPRSFGNSEDRFFKITNTGAGPITFTSQTFTGSQAADFTVILFPTLPFTLATGEEEEFRISWEPPVGGQRNAIFELRSNLTSTPFTFALRGSATEPDIRVSRILDNGGSVSVSDSTFSGIDYGTSERGIAHSRTLEVENTGFGTLVVSTITSDNPKFQINHSIASLAPGASEQFTIIYTPTAQGHDEALIAISSNDPDDEIIYNFVTEGFGEDDTGSGEIVVTSTLLGKEIPPMAIPRISSGTDFGEVALGNSATREFTISNIGTNPLFVSSTTLDNTAQFSVPDTTATLLAGEETTFTVTYSPSTTTEHATTVFIFNSDPDDGPSGDESPYQLQLSGTGALQVPDISIHAVGLAQIPVGSAPSEALGTLLPTQAHDPSGLPSANVYYFDFVIENEGTAELEFDRLMIGAPFGTSTDLFEVTLAPGQSTALTLDTESLSNAEPGTYRSTITLINNDGDEGIYTFDVQITLTSLGNEPKILSITESGNDILLEFFLPTDGGYFIDESEDLATWSLMAPPSFLGSAGIQTKTRSGRAAPPASGHRYFRVRLEN